MLSIYFYLSLSFALGLIIGSFLNCLIWRIYTKKTIQGRSICPKCQKQISWHDNIPVLSFLLLKAKCRHCKKPISWQYPLIELVAGILFALAFYKNFQLLIFNDQFSINALIFLFRDWFLISVLIVIFVYDLRWYLIPDIVTLPACAIILIFNLALDFEWQNLALAGIIGGGFFLIQFMASRGRWIGGGDIRLGLLMGLALGWPNILVALFLAYILGSIIGVGLILAGKKKMGSEVPFGVFLTFATLIALFWGNEIIAWYWSLLL